MDKCEQVREMLADYRSGLLNSRKTAWVEEHLRQCSACANELHVLDDVLEMVEAHAPESEPPAGLWNGVCNRISSPEPKPLFGGLGNWLSKPIRAAGIGAAAIALAVGLIIGTGPREPAIPLQVASNMEYVQGHALYAGQDPLADRVSYLSVVAASSESSK